MLATKNIRWAHHHFFKWAFNFAPKVGLRDEGCEEISSISPIIADLSSFHAMFLNPTLILDTKLRNVEAEARNKWT